MDTTVSLLGIFLLCLFFSSLKGVSSAAAPLIALCSGMLWFAAFGMMGQLLLGGWLFYAACLLLGGGALWRGKTALLTRMLTPGFVLFMGMAVALMVYFAVRQPLFTGWDEYSFWGLAAKTTKATGVLYPLAKTGFSWTMTEYPALVMLGYLGQFFGAFAPWKVFWAYGLLYLACVASLLAAFSCRRWRIWVPLAVAGLAIPFFFGSPMGTVQLADTWMSAYADLPGGMLFGGVLCLYFSVRQSPDGRLWQVLPVLGALAMVKENIMPIALVAAGVFALDCLVFGISPGGGAPLGAAAKGRLPQPAARGLWAAAFPASVAVPFVVWKRYALWANSQNPARHGGALTNSNTASGSVLQALKEVLGFAPKSEGFLQVAEELPATFLGRVRSGDGWVHGVLKTSMAGTGLLTVLLIVSLFVLAVLLAKTARQRGRLFLAGAVLLGGYAAYHFELFVVYAFLNHTRDILDYPRYTTSYTAGWFMAGLLFVGLCAKWATGNRRLFGRTALLTLALFMTVRTAALVRPGYSVMDFPENTFAIQQTQQAQAEGFAAHMQAGARVFFVCQTGDGSEFFRWHYYLQPGVVVDTSITGGWPLRWLPEALAGTDDGARLANLDTLTQYLQETGCDYVVVDAIDQDFANNYGSLFTELSLGDAPALYKLDDEGRYARVEVE